MWLGLVENLLTALSNPNDLFRRFAPDFPDAALFDLAQRFPLAGFILDIISSLAEAVLHLILGKP